MPHKFQKGINDFKTWCELSGCTELLSEWNYEKNEELTPSDVTYGSKKKVWWKCSEGHAWQTSIQVIIRCKGCPICSNKQVLVGYNDLATVNPKLAEEWNYEKNAGLTNGNGVEISTPERVTANSSQKVWWKCSEGHSWQATIANRVKGTKCPYCSNRIIVAGYNDLATTNPTIASEWDYEKNYPLTPSEVTYGSHKKVWWKCPKGHEWLCMIKERTRTRATGCPKCHSEISTSFPEQALYYYLSQHFPDAENRYLFDDYEIDIYIPSIKMGVEYDGEFYHSSKTAQINENKKNNYLIKNGIHLFRVKESTENRVDDDIIFYKPDHSFKTLNWAIKELINALGKNTDNSIINISSDRIAILQQYVEAEKRNSLSVKCPEIEREWNYEKNGSLLPSAFSYSSNLIVWWKCPKGHEWQAAIDHRARGQGCPVCSNRMVVAGVNDLATVNPKLVEEWNYEKNGELMPQQVLANSSKKAWWKCPKGHEWQTSIEHRARGQGCPICSNKQVLVGYNDLATVYPELIKEWNFEKNKGIKPTDYVFSSSKKVWWIDSFKHEWQAVIYCRTVMHQGCPICRGKKILSGFNDLQTKNPKLAEEWNYKKNAPILPSEVSPFSHSKVWWKCSSCGNEWSASIKHRNYGSGCPVCAKQKRAK